MLEERKQKETQHYDEKALEFQGSGKLGGDFEGFDPFSLRSFVFLKEYLADKLSGKTVLDFGCGNGVHSVWLAKLAGKLAGIDLSEESLKIARQRLAKAGLENKADFLAMDCENLEFQDNAFDIVFDGGTFSSLELERALREISRVLKPSGFLIGIETFGHNPIANFKRQINKKTGKRTAWAMEHIFKERSLKEARKYFDKIETHYFHLFSWVFLPILKFPLGKSIFNFIEAIDAVVLKVFPFFIKYCFKIVFIFSNPKK